MSPLKREKTDLGWRKIDHMCSLKMIAHMVYLALLVGHDYSQMFNMIGISLQSKAQYEEARANKKFRECRISFFYNRYTCVWYSKGRRLIGASHVVEMSCRCSNALLSELTVGDTLG